MATQLPEIVVHGDDFGTWNWYEFAPDWQRDLGAPAPPASGGGAAPAPNESFAPPMPIVLPEVPITAPKLAPPAPPAPPILAPIVEAIARVAAPITALFFPQPMGPRELDEAPTLLPEVRVTAPPPPPRRPNVVPLDPIMPPNWWDLAQPQWYEPPGRMPGWIPNPEIEIAQPYRPPAPAPLPAPTLEPFDDPIEIPDLAPRRTPEPRRAPRVSPNPFGNPFAAPDFIGSPIGDFPVLGAPDVRADPGTDTRSRPKPVPVDITSPFGDVGTPIGDPFSPEIPVDFSTPPRPTFDNVPDSFDVPDALERQPWGTPPNKADPCNCAATKEKKKKKRKPRNVCYRGTYTERANGLTKKKIEQVPCASPRTAKKSSVDRVRNTASKVLDVLNLF